MFLFVENSEFEGFGFIQDQDLSGCIFANRDPGISQGISRAVSLDLVDNLFELDGQVFGNKPGLLPGQDVIKIFKMRQWAVCIMRAARGHTKALIEIFNKFG